MLCKFENLLITTKGARKLISNPFLASSDAAPRPQPDPGEGGEMRLAAGLVAEGQASSTPPSSESHSIEPPPSESVLIPTSPLFLLYTTLPLRRLYSCIPLPPPPSQSTKSKRLFTASTLFFSLSLSPSSDDDSVLPPSALQGVLSTHHFPTPLPPL